MSIEEKAREREMYNRRFGATRMTKEVGADITEKEIISDILHNQDMQIILKNIVEFLGGDQGYIYFEDSQKEIKLEYYTYKDVLENFEVFKDRLQTLTNKLRRREISKTISLNSIKEYDVDFYWDLKERSILDTRIIPILVHGKVRGVIGFESKKLLDRHIDELKNVIKLIQLSYERQDYIDELECLHKKDALTGVLNRESFIKYTSTFGTNPVKMLGIGCININSLKEANDILGYEYGDRVIVEVANELINIWGYNNVYRIDGDEFILIVEHNQEEFYKALDETVTNIEQNTVASVAIGGEWRDQYITLQDMVASADQKMYENKQYYYRQSPSTIRFRYESISTATKKAYEELRQAIKKKEFYLEYQPKVCTDTAETVGIEALIRWKKEDGTYITADEFIPRYEENKLINLIDYYVLEQVITQILEMEAQGEIMPIAINISKATMLEENFFQYLQMLPRMNEISKYIELEINERDIDLQEIEDMGDRVSKLQKLGFKVAIDDFGTGTSNLLLMSRLHINTLKIDKSITRYITQNDNVITILKSIIDGCKRIGVDVVMEGVESLEQLNKLRELDKTISQGYYFSKPVDIIQIKKSYR